MGIWIAVRGLEVPVSRVHAAVPRPVRSHARAVLVHLPLGREHRGGQTARVSLVYRGYDVVREDSSSALVVLDGIALVFIAIDVHVVSGSVGVVRVVSRSAGSHRVLTTGRDEWKRRVHSRRAPPPRGALDGTRVLRRREMSSPGTRAASRARRGRAMRRRVDLGGSETRTVLETVSVRFFSSASRTGAVRDGTAGTGRSSSPPRQQTEPNLGDLA